MNTITTMTLDELKNLPPLTEEEKQTIHNATSTPTDDCPAMSKEELTEFRPWYAKSKKTITINLDKSVDFKKRGVEVHSWIERAENGKIQISFALTEKGVRIFYQTLIVDHEERALRMQNNFSERAEDIYKGMIAMMEGNANYLFDN